MVQIGSVEDEWSFRKMNSQMECTQNLQGAAYKCEQRQLKPRYLLELLLKIKLVDFQ